MLLVAVRTAHSVIFLVLQPAAVYPFFTGIQGRTDRGTAMAAAVVCGDGLVLVARLPSGRIVIGWTSQPHLNRGQLDSTGLAPCGVAPVR